MTVLVLRVIIRLAVSVTHACLIIACLEVQLLPVLQDEVSLTCEPRAGAVTANVLEELIQTVCPRCLPAEANHTQVL